MKHKIEVPRVPNFIKVLIGKEHYFFPLTSFTDEEIDEIVNMWKTAVLANRARQEKEENAPKEVGPG